MKSFEDILKSYIEDNRNELERLFIDQIPPEEQPLDDDIADFFHYNAQEFEEFCTELCKTDLYR